MQIIHKMTKKNCIYIRMFLEIELSQLESLAAEMKSIPCSKRNF